MIIYMYLTIIIVFSILTGVITTIIEKKGLKANVSQSVIQSVDVPNRVVRIQKSVTTSPLSVVCPEEKMSKTVETIHIPQDSSKSYIELLDDHPEPVRLGVIDDEII